MSDLAVLMAAVLIGGTMALATISDGVSNLTQSLVGQMTGQPADFSAKFIKP